MIDVHGIRIAADLVGIAHIRLGAGAHDTILGCVLGIEVVVAETFVAIFRRCVGEATIIAVVDANLHRHVVIVRPRTIHGSIAHVVRATSKILPFLDRSQVDVVGRAAGTKCW